MLFMIIGRVVYLFNYLLGNRSTPNMCLLQHYMWVKADTTLNRFVKGSDPINFLANAMHSKRIGYTPISLAGTAPAVLDNR